MRPIILFVISLKFSFLFSQEDKLKFNFDVNVGQVIYNYNLIQNYSFQQFTYRGLNYLGHVGLHIPVYKSYYWSFGLNPKVGGGKLVQRSGSNKNYNIGNELLEGDKMNIDSYTFDGSLTAYARINMSDLIGIDSHFSFLAGYRYLQTKDTYSTPIIGFEIGQNWWSFEFYSHLISMHYYRQYTDGTKDIYKCFHELGVSLNFYLGKKLY